jgi:response regulator RpfG family c-di-GMP phosphodiesterase
LIDQSENASFKEGKWLYERCEVLARDLLTTLSAVGEAWDVVNNASLGEFGSVERSPTIAAYAGLMSLLATMGEPVDVMIAALLADVGMLELNPAIARKVRQGHGPDSLSGEEMQEYQKHPRLSLNRCAGKKLPLKENVKEMILCTHERVDGKGFPEGRESAKIPQEAMLIQFSEMIDRGAMVTMGQARTPVQEVRKNLVETEQKSAHIFSYTFLQKIKPVI